MPDTGYEMTFDPPNDDAEYYEIPTPPGTFLDLAAAHLMSSATLAACAEARVISTGTFDAFGPTC